MTYVCVWGQVTVCGQSAEGMGPSKKVAKRNAAEKMLDLLGYKVPQPQLPKPALKTDEKVFIPASRLDPLRPVWGLTVVFGFSAPCEETW